MPPIPFPWCQKGFHLKRYYKSCFLRKDALLINAGAPASNEKSPDNIGKLKFVEAALLQVLKKYSDVCLIQYMNDMLISHAD